ncbi:hypothetical protein PMAYCL1PPCAC_25401, partial [Pristionchus mayeri]
MESGLIEFSDSLGVGVPHIHCFRNGSAGLTEACIHATSARYEDTTWKIRLKRGFDVGMKINFGEERKFEIIAATCTSADCFDANREKRLGVPS